MHFGSGSIVASRGAFSHAGSPRPARPGQLDQAIADNIVGGLDPEYVTEMSHATAWALLSHVHATKDPQVVERVLTIVDREGVDVIAELWSHAEPDSLPGVLWRLYCLREWMRRHSESIARLWRLGEPIATAASAIAGVDSAPTEDDIARTADSILTGAFRGDFAVALTRAATFIEVVVAGLRVQSRRLLSRAEALGDNHDADVRKLRSQAAKLMHTAGNLTSTATDLKAGAHLWRTGKLE